MKKIDLNEEFALNGGVYMFIPKGESMALKYVRESKSKPSFQPPTLQEVKDFFLSKGYREDAAIKFHEYYSAGDWKDGKGNQVKNWKQKSMAVWFKDENKIQTAQPTGLKFFM